MKDFLLLWVLCYMFKLEVRRFLTMRHMELFMVFQTKEGSKTGIQAVPARLLLCCSFQTPSLHAYLDFATEDTICFAFSDASEPVWGVLGKTRMLRFCAHEWAGGKSWAQQDTLAQIRQEGLNLKASDMMCFLESHLYCHTINTLITGVGGVPYVSKEVQILF